MDFVVSNARRGLDFPEPRADGADPRYAIDEDDCLQRLLAPETCDAMILELLDRMGPRVLWADSRWGDLSHDIREDRRRNTIRALARERVDKAHVEARCAPNPERHSAQAFLRSIGRVLAGNQRGRRDKAVVDFREVRVVYYRHLFRLRRALDLLRLMGDLSSKGSRTKTLRHVARVCGLRKDALRSRFYTSDGELRGAVREAGRATLRCEQQARIWTAQQFNITEQTVHNILAPSGVRELLPSFRKGSAIASRARRSV
jgi:hypothetical protein